MKSKIFLLACLPMFTFNFLSTSCSDAEEDKEMTHLRDSMNTVTEGQDSVIQSFLVTFNEIGNSLDSVAHWQANVESLSEKNKEHIEGATRENINYNISLINKMMVENQEKIDALNKKIKSSNKRQGLLEKTIKTLERQLLNKNAELMVMSDRLMHMADSITTLQTNVDTQNMITSMQATRIMEQSKELHKAYYIIGEKKELEKRKVINSEGGILGMGKTQKIASDMDKNNFTEIDYYVSTTIFISSEDPEILTSHPSDSYTLEKGETSSIIQITNPEQFWSINKFLVVKK